MNNLLKHQKRPRSQMNNLFISVRVIEEERGLP